MSGVNTPGRARLAAKTLRTDNWRRAPALTAAGLLLFVVYGGVRAFQFDHYYSAPYLSPFYSPCITTGCVPEASDFGQPISWWPLSPALIILICAVAEPHKKYSGETRFPLIFQNVHRYFWYVAMIFGVILTYDAILGFRNAEGDWGHMGLGTVFLLVNAALIWLYTLSCHSCRHIMVGKLKHTRRGNRSPSSMRGTCNSPGHRCSGCCSPTSTSCCCPPEPSPT